MAQQFNGLLTYRPGAQVPFPSPDLAVPGDWDLVCPPWGELGRPFFPRPGGFNPGEAGYHGRKLRWRKATMSDNTIPIDDLCQALENLDQAETVQGAEYREQAQALLANDSVAPGPKMAIADLLMEGNQRLVMKTVQGEDSY